MYVVFYYRKRKSYSTDLGQKTAIYPDEGMLAFATKLYEAGFSAEEVRKTTVYNPVALLK